MRKILFLFGVIVGAFAAVPASAQNTTGLVVATCGTPPQAFNAGRPGPFTVDTTGTLCTAGGGGGGGGNITQWNSVALGSPSTYGTSPGSVNVPGVNAFVTNATALGQAVMASSNPVVIASNQSAVPSSVAAGSNITEGNTTDTPCTVPTSATACTLDAILKAVANGAITLGPAAITSSVPTIPSSQYPGNATAASNPITISATGTTGAVTATLAAAANKTTFICGFNIDSDATAATVVAATLTGTVTGTMNFRESVGAVASATAHNPQNFSPCIPASGVNTAIVVNAGAAGAAGNTAVSAWGYQL